MPFNFSSLEYLSHHRTRKSRVSPGSRASPAHKKKGMLNMMYLRITSSFITVKVAWMTFSNIKYWRIRKVDTKSREYMIYEALLGRVLMSLFWISNIVMSRFELMRMYLSLFHIFCSCHICYFIIISSFPICCRNFNKHWFPSSQFQILHDAVSTLCRLSKFSLTGPHISIQIFHNVELCHYREIRA